MKFGTSLRFFFPTSPQTHEMFRQMLAAAKGEYLDRPLGAYETELQANNLLEVASAACAAGLDTLLVGDHHAISSGFANVFQPVPTLARLLPLTGEMTVGMVLLAPFYNPVLLAEQIGTLAAFAQRPLIVTFAAGGRAQQFEAFGMEMKTRTRRLQEMVSILRGLLAGEAVRFEGRYHRLDGVMVSPLPQKPVSLWVAGTTRASAARAGEWGDAWLSSGAATPEELAVQIDVYREAAVRAGRPVLPVVRRDIYVGETDAEAEATIEPIVSHGYRGWSSGTLLVGAAATVVQQLRDYRALGFEHVLVRHIVGDHDLMLRSFERIGRSVLPEIRDL